MILCLNSAGDSSWTFACLHFLFNTAKTCAMGALVRMLVVSGICFVPVAAVIFVVSRQRRSRLASHAAPFPELRRRPPGTGLRTKIAQLDEKILNYICLIVVLPILIGLTAYYVQSALWLTMALPIAGCATWTLVLGFKLNRALRERDNHSLGCEGELFVGEELSRLVVYQYEVYHDVPFDGFNIDHVLVGPGGVFSIETKTRRKPVTDSGKEYRVGFDGSCLRWPWGTDTYGLEQAENNARTLSQWLSSAVGDPVQVTPILTLPGWMVDRSVPSSKVQVLNPKEIAKTVRNANGEKLSENLIKRICHQLDQKCRLPVE